MVWKKFKFSRLYFEVDTLEIFGVVFSAISSNEKVPHFVGHKNRNNMNRDFFVYINKFNTLFLHWKFENPKKIVIDQERDFPAYCTRPTPFHFSWLSASFTTQCLPINPKRFPEIRTHESHKNNIDNIKKRSELQLSAIMQIEHHLPFFPLFLQSTYFKK